MGRLQSGQMQRTVNPSSFDFDGSNPSLPTKNDISEPGSEKSDTYVAFFYAKKSVILLGENYKSDSLMVIIEKRLCKSIYKN